MRSLEGSPWQHMTQQEFENALDAMEKLVMNRLYELYGSPIVVFHFWGHEFITALSNHYCPQLYAQPTTSNETMYYNSGFYYLVG